MTSGDPFRHPDWIQRFLACKAVVTDPQPRHFAAVRRLLEDPEGKVRAQAAAALAAIGSRRALAPLLEGMADPNDWVRVEIAKALGRLGDRRAAPVLAQHLQGETEPHVRATVVRVLGAIGDAAVLPMIRLMLDDPDPRVRANGIEALTQLNPSGSEFTEVFVALSQDRHNRVRANSALALERMGNGEGLKVLSEMLDSSNEYMRASAIWAFGQIACADHLPQLLRHLDDSSWLVRRNAVKTVVRHGSAALPGVLRALRAKSPAMRLGALEVLAELRDPRVRPAVIAMLDDPAGEVRAKAEEILDQLGLSPHDAADDS